MAETDCDVVHCPTVGNKNWMFDQRSTDVVKQFAHVPTWIACRPTEEKERAMFRFSYLEFFAVLFMLFFFPQPPPPEETMSVHKSVPNCVYPFNTYITGGVVVFI